jgi:hypothetical protein
LWWTQIHSELEGESPPFPGKTVWGLPQSVDFFSRRPA